MSNVLIGAMAEPMVKLPGKAADLVTVITAPAATSISLPVPGLRVSEPPPTTPVDLIFISAN